MWFRRLLVVLVVLGAVGAGVWYYFFYQAPPDARLACYYGAYDLDDGRLLVVTPSSGVQSLRYVLMDGTTARLDLIAKGSEPNRFSVHRGWSTEAINGAQVTFGACDEGTIEVADDVVKATGRQRAFDITPATFDSHGLELFGRLVMPKGSGPVPVAILVHGSEYDSAVLFNRLQYLLPANGVGVFVYDKRGTGDSDGKYTQDFDLLADDAAAALTKAREIAGTRAGEIGFVGGSQAGWIEPLAAGKVKTDFVLVGFGLVESPLAEDRDEVFDDLRTAGYGDDVIAKAREITDATGRVVASHFKEGYDELDAVREKYGKEPWYEKAQGEWTGDVLAYPNWVTQIVGPWLEVGTPMAYEPLPALNAYQGPHLWILAGRDSSAPSENTLRILRGVQASHPNFDIVMFPTADHGITEFIEKNGERIDTRFSEGYFPLIVDWVKRKRATVTSSGPVVYEGGDASDTPPQGEMPQ